MSSPACDLSVVVPVHNAVDSIGQVVEDVLHGHRWKVEVILVDDRSTDGSARLVDELDRRHPEVTAFHHGRNLGAGVARNNGFDFARGRYTLFFDADDVIHTDVVDEALRRLDASGADLAFTRYRYRRGDADLPTSMNPSDVRIWDRYADISGDGRTVALDDVPGLLGFTNYPWNKVLRTATYQETGLRFGRGRVHNDVLGHWHVLLWASGIIMVDKDMCTHVVEPEGEHLTNTATADRLQVFDALHEAYDLLVSRPNLRFRYSHVFWSFALQTMAWAEPRIPDDARIEFHQRRRKLLMRVSLDDFTRMRAARDPALATRMVAAALR